MANKHAFAASDIAAALRATAGIKTAAAKHAGCSVDTIDRYIRDYPTVAAAAQQARSGIVDRAESILVQRLNRGEWDAAKFVLTTLGKDRGWGHSVDVTVTVDEMVKRIVDATGDPPEIVRPFVTDFVAEKKRRVA
jgi:hypothetical protein